MPAMKKQGEKLLECLKPKHNITRQEVDSTFPPEEGISLPLPPQSFLQFHVYGRWDDAAVVSEPGQLHNPTN